LAIVSVFIFLGRRLTSVVSPTSSQSSRLTPEESTSRPFPLAIDPDPIVLGVVHAGEPGETSFSVRNTCAEPLTFDRIETSCPCITIAEIPLRLGPNEIRKLRVAFDPTHEPDFKGRLSVDVTAYLHGNSIAFRTNVNLEAR